jgi:hypothetical protein
MFSDRGWIIKLAAAAGLIAGLCWMAHWRIADEYPPVDRLAYEGEALKGRTIFLWGRRVEAQDPAGFQIATSLGPIRVLSGVHPAVGEYVSVVARATGPRTLEAVRLQVSQGFVWKRSLTYVVSILTVIAYLWIVRRRFRWRIHEGVFRSRY